MDKLSLIGWTSFDSDYPSKEINKKEFKFVVNLIQKDIVKNCYMFSGEEHQSSLNCVPVFSDGTCFRASIRCWGSIMASIYKESDNKKLSYIDFCFSLKEKSVLPDYREIKVKPKQIKNKLFGYYIKEDLEQITQCLNSNMEFVTTDKVLKRLYEDMISNV
ncbi:MAG: hypothetical protein IJW82_02155 [Clostridia bacterium]|nr:hypothetical protein [Clostridia bacterium]